MYYYVTFTVLIEVKRYINTKIAPNGFDNIFHIDGGLVSVVTSNIYYNCTIADTPLFTTMVSVKVRFSI